jgi:hypothetical protein
VCVWRAGKTTILKTMFQLPKAVEWSATASVDSHFESPDGRERLGAVGLPAGASRAVHRVSRVARLRVAIHLALSFCVPSAELRPR